MRNTVAIKLGLSLNLMLFEFMQAFYDDDDDDDKSKYQPQHFL